MVDQATVGELLVLAWPGLQPDGAAEGGLLKNSLLNMTVKTKNPSVTIVTYLDRNNQLEGARSGSQLDPDLIQQVDTLKHSILGSA